MSESQDSTKLLLLQIFKLDPIKDWVTISKVMDLFSERVKKGESYEQIFQELLGLEYLQKQAISIAQQNYPVVCDSHGRVRYNLVCDPYTLALKIELQIEPHSNHRLRGRTILINVLHRSANNDFSPHDINSLFEAKVSATLALFPANKFFARDIAQIVDELVQTKEILIRKFSQFSVATALNAQDAQIRKIYIKAIINLNDKLLTHLAIATVRQQRRDPNYNPNASQIKAAKLSIKQSEIELSSQQQRPVIIHAYYQESAAHAGIRGLITHFEPITDISSDLRTFPDQQLSNYGKTTIHSLAFNQSFNPLRPPITQNIYHSSSIAELIDPLTDDGLEEDTNPKAKTDKVSADKLLSIERAVLKKIMIETAKKQLIEKLLAARDLKTVDSILRNKIAAKVAFITLLTPILDKKNALYLTKKLPIMKKSAALTNTLLKGNELEQLMSMYLSFTSIEDTSSAKGTQIELSPMDLHDIKAALRTRPHIVEKLNAIKSLEIHPKISFLNIPVNQDPIFGLPGKKLDFTKYNPIYNAEGMQKLIRNILDYLEEYYPDERDRHQLFRNYLSASLTIDKKDLRAWRDNLISSVASFDSNLQNIALHFSRINLHIHNISVSQKHNSWNADAYLVAAADVYVLNNILGYATHVTCKSGKDRTGLFCLLREALIDANNNAQLIDNICNALRFSSAKAKNALNVAGGRGIQIDEDILDGLHTLFGQNFVGSERIKAILKVQQARKISSISKKVYNSTRAAKSWLKQHKPSEPEVTLAGQLGLKTQSYLKNIGQFLTSYGDKPAQVAQPKAVSEPFIPTSTSATDSDHKDPLLAELKERLRNRPTQIPPTQKKN